MIYITRHGETEWNTERRMQGHNNSPLTQLGIRQAGWLAERLKDVQLDLIVSSPLERAMQTARILADGRQIEIKPHNALKEIYLGSWEGQKVEDVQRVYPVAHHHFWHAPHEYVPLDGESYPMLQARLSSFVKHELMHYAHKNILIVTHAVTIKTIVNLIAHNGDLSRLWHGEKILPASLTTVEYTPDGFKLISVGDISHYKEPVVQGGWFSEKSEK